GDAKELESMTHPTSQRQTMPQSAKNSSVDKIERRPTEPTTLGPFTVAALKETTPKEATPKQTIADSTPSVQTAPLEPVFYGSPALAARTAGFSAKPPRPPVPTVVENEAKLEEIEPAYPEDVQRLAMPIGDDGPTATIKGFRIHAAASTSHW